MTIMNIATIRLDSTVSHNKNQPIEAEKTVPLDAMHTKKKYSRGNLGSER